MKRLRIKDLRLMILFIVFAVFFNHQSLIINHVQAAESTPSAETKSKLEELKKEIASKAAKLKQEINSKLQNKAYIGTIKTQSEKSLTLATVNGPKIISINQDTEYENQNTAKKIKKLSIDTLEAENYIAALGDIDDTSVLTAKKIILLPVKQQEAKQTLWGQVATISEKSVTVKDKSQKNQTISISNNTTIKKGNDETNFSTVAIGNTILVSGYITEEGLFEASLIYILPINTTSEPQVASNSAKISTPSTKPKATPTSTAKPKSPKPKPIKD